MKTLETVSLDDARRVIAAGEAAAHKIGSPSNLAVVDAGGNLVAHIRMDGAWIGSVEIAINKAFTSRAFDIATGDLGDNAQPGGQFDGISASNGGRRHRRAGPGHRRGGRRRALILAATTPSCLRPEGETTTLGAWQHRRLTSPGASMVPPGSS